MTVKFEYIKDCVILKELAPPIEDEEDERDKEQLQADVLQVPLSR